jgi:hypothetical protein
MEWPPGVKRLLLDELPDPPADEVADRRHANADYEHIEA